MMSSSSSSKSEGEEPSSYQHMEQALSNVIVNATAGIVGTSSSSGEVVTAEPSNTESQRITNSSSARASQPAPAISPQNQSLSAETPTAKKPSAPEGSISSTMEDPLFRPSQSKEFFLNTHDAPPTSTEARPLSEIASFTAGPPMVISASALEDTGEADVVNVVAAAASAFASMADSTDDTTSTIPFVIQPTPFSERSTKSKGGSLRRGKWTAEEEAYVARVIQDFNSGFLNAPAGTTLRSYLSDKLQCDPMRITKKFTGESCIGKRVFHPAVRSATNASAIDKAQVSNLVCVLVSVCWQTCL